MVRPSRNNLHEFVAEENTCFFDICLPNYTADSLRRITYFREIVAANSGNAAEINLGSANLDLASMGLDHKTLADSTMDLSSRVDGLKFIEYDSTPPTLPVDFEIADIPYIGEMK